MKELTISTVDWRKYLDVNVNPRAKRFLDSRGDDVLWQIAQNLHKNSNSRLVMLVHENAPSGIEIKSTDYNEVFDLCIKYFESKEHYEKCQKILSFKNANSNTPKNIVKKELNKNLI